MNTFSVYFPRSGLDFITFRQPTLASQVGWRNVMKKNPENPVNPVKIMNRFKEDSKTGNGSSKYINHFFSGHHFNFRYS